jgi:hypothetical protein
MRPYRSARCSPGYWQLRAIHLAKRTYHPAAALESWRNLTICSCQLNTAVPKLREVGRQSISWIAMVKRCSRATTFRSELKPNSELHFAFG